VLVLADATGCAGLVKKGDSEYGWTVHWETGPGSELRVWGS